MMTVGLISSMLYVGALAFGNISPELRMIRVIVSKHDRRISARQITK
jgi:hypothetical protein